MVAISACSTNVIKILHHNYGESQSTATASATDASATSAYTFPPPSEMTGCSLIPAAAWKTAGFEPQHPDATIKAGSQQVCLCKIIIRHAAY